jgi:hypothetical protein
MGRARLDQRRGGDVAEHGLLDAEVLLDRGRVDADFPADQLVALLPLHREGCELRLQPARDAEGLRLGQAW